MQQSQVAAQVNQVIIAGSILGRRDVCLEPRVPLGGQEGGVRLDLGQQCSRLGVCSADGLEQPFRRRTEVTPHHPIIRFSSVVERVAEWFIALPRAVGGRLRAREWNYERYQQHAKGLEANSPFKAPLLHCRRAGEGELVFTWNHSSPTLPDGLEGVKRQHFWARNSGLIDAGLGVNLVIKSWYAQVI